MRGRHKDGLSDSLPITATRQYRRAAHYNITHLRRQSFYSLPSAHMDLLSEPPFSLPYNFDAVDEAIDSNADLSEAILAVGLRCSGIEPDNDSWKGQATPNDMNKARSTLRQFYRDWSVEGLTERHASYSPIVSALETHLPAISPAQRHQQHVLVPGAGLSRLLFDLCTAGYTVEGNEISHHQLLASNYILNYTESAGQHRVFPWALNFSNHMSRSAQLQSVKVPDILPATTLAMASESLQSSVDFSKRMAMTAGDFCELYRQSEYKDTFQAVATCFFIDTAPNVINYLDAIKHCLNPGGLWVNLGPLLWHFESAPTPAERDRQHRQRGSNQGSHLESPCATVHEQNGSPVSNGIGEPGSFELSDEEVLALVSQLGFEVLEHKQAPAGSTGYIQDPTSMLQNVYSPSFWVARKR